MTYTPARPGATDTVPASLALEIRRHLFNVLPTLAGFALCSIGITALSITARGCTPPPEPVPVVTHGPPAVVYLPPRCDVFRAGLTLAHTDENGTADVCFCATDGHRFAWISQTGATTCGGAE